MNELPDVGDFARIVGGACCASMAENIGQIVLVLHISEPDHACECPACGHIDHGCVARCADCKADEGYMHRWLRKMPPDRQVLDEIEREVVPA